MSRLALDHPNQRSLHESPVPRTGGVGLHAAILCAWVIAAPDVPLTLLIGLGLLLAISFVDDVRGVPVIARLLAHLLAAGLFAMSVLFEELGPVGVLVGTLAIAWMTNLYNFMDGSDGLAGGMTLFGFAFYGIAALQSGSPSFAMLNFGVAAAAAAFLIFNFHPARVFMGDVGSVPLGFLAAAFGVLGWLQHMWTWWFSVLVFSPFIVDASVTLARRLLRGERVWEAHREHYYQRLVQLGWGHRGTAIAEYAAMLTCGLTGLIALNLPFSGQAAALLSTLVAYAVLLATIEHAWRESRMAK